MARTLSRPQLCLVTDLAVPDLLARVEQALRVGVTMVQLRGHQTPAAQLYTLGCALRALCREHNALFLVNDRLDVGLATAADGYQLGIRALPLPVARQIVGDQPLLSASVHSMEEARVAVSQGADLLLVGTVFPSSSHPGEATCGLELLQTIRQRFPKISMLAIGGITYENAGSVIEAGADGIAVISAVLKAGDIPGAVKKLWGVIDRERARNERSN